MKLKLRRVYRDDPVARCIEPTCFKPSLVPADGVLVQFGTYEPAHYIPWSVLDAFRAGEADEAVMDPWEEAERKQGGSI